MKSTDQSLIPSLSNFFDISSTPMSSWNTDMFYYFEWLRSKMPIWLCCWLFQGRLAICQLLFEYSGEPPSTNLSMYKENFHSVTVCSVRWSTQNSQEDLWQGHRMSEIKKNHTQWNLFWIDYLAIHILSTSTLPKCKQGIFDILHLFRHR